MSTFSCPVVRVTVEPHPNADAIELARVGGYVSIVKKGQFKDGDLAVYIPEQAVMPDWMLKQLGFWDDLNSKGKLSGSKGNRVKAIKLRGILSQGILLDGYQHEGRLMLEGSVPDGCTDPDPTRAIKRFDEGDDVAEFLGVTKYEPIVPANMQGKVAGGDLDATIAYDFEALKKNPNLFEPGQEVVITEKIHGTLLQVGLIPEHIWSGKPWADKCPQLAHGFRCIVTSKGQGAKGLMLDPSDDSNLYVQVVKNLSLWLRLEHIRFGLLGHPNDQPLFMFGEIFGVTQTEGGPKAIQDLTYGQDQPAFRAFDIYAGTRNDGFFLPQDLFDQAMRFVGLSSVPQLYRGPFDPSIVDYHTNGMTTVGSVAQIREGVVVKSTKSDKHPRYGRRIAKSVSEAYLMRKGNTTEFQ